MHRRVCADLKRARDEIRRPNCTVAVVLDGRVLARECGDGVAPLVRVMGKLCDCDAGAVIADRIAGMAAALFLHSPQIAGVYADVMSTPARNHLEGSGMVVCAEKEVPAILNRDGDDLCPLEKMATTDDPETVRHRIRDMMQGSSLHGESENTGEE